MTDKDCAAGTIATDCFIFEIVNGTLDPNKKNGTLVPEVEWDDLLWTPEQRRLLQQGALPQEVQISLGVLLALFVVFGIFANSIVLYVFSRYRADNKSGTISFSFRLSWLNQVYFLTYQIHSQASTCIIYRMKVVIDYFFLGGGGQWRLDSSGWGRRTTSSSLTWRFAISSRAFSIRCPFTRHSAGVGHSVKQVPYVGVQ